MASTYISRTQGTPTNSKKWTISFWMKGKLTNGNFYAIFGCDYDQGDSYYGVGSGGQGKNEIGLLEYHTGATNYGQGYTDASLRDSSGWYHIVFAYDSTQATASDRGKTYINGVFNNSTYVNNIPLNHDSKFNTSGVGIRVGNRSAGGGSANYDGCLSHFHFIDGTAYDATPFGSTDSTTGEWKINTSPSVTYGTNGFFILKDGNSVTDQSGNSNNFTVAGGTLTNTEDNPSNVFATLNPLVNNAGAMMALTKGNLTCESTTTSPAWKLAVSTLGMTSGKYYWEVKFDNVHNCYNTGIMGSNLLTANTSNIMSQIGYTGFYNNDGGEFRVDNTDTTVDYGLYNTGDIMGIACDMDNYTITFYKNGVSHVSSQSISTTGRDMVFPCSVHYQTNGGVQASYNFGNGYFGTTAVSSAGTNASGNGIFEYDVPTGYTALSTKGLNL